MGKDAPPRRNVAIFMDVENLFGGNHRDVTGVQLGKVVRGIEAIIRASGIGAKTATVRAYANWARPEMGLYKREVQAYGIKPVQIFSFEKNVKNAADIELCVEVLEVAQDAPWVDVFVIVTGDGGFVPLIRRLHGLNKYVVVVSTTAPNAGLVNPLLKSVADEYHQIDVQGAPRAPGAMQPVPVVVQPPVPWVPVAARKVASAPPAPLVPKKSPAGPPELAVLRKYILDVVREQPQLSKKGQVDAAALGQLVRKKWPGLKYTTYQTTNLGGFLEKNCGLVARGAITQQVKAAVAVVPAQKPPADSPELAVLRKYILDVVREQPQLSKKGQVDAAALSQLLRKKWPGLKYASYQSGNLSSFVEKHCGLIAHRPVPKHAKAAAMEPVRAAAPAVTSREEYAATVRELFTDGELGHLALSQGSDGMALGDVSARLREAITGFTSADAGFPQLHTALRHALGGTEFHVARTDTKTMAVVHGSHVDHGQVLPPIAAEDLKDPDLVRRVLGRREPIVRYPEKFILSNVIKLAFESTESPGRAHFVASVHSGLPHVPVETVNHTVGLLLAVGALIEDDGTGCLTVSPQAGTEFQALEMVIDDALRRASEVRWPVNAGELLLALS